MYGQIDHTDWKDDVYVDVAIEQGEIYSIIFVITLSDWNNNE